MSDRFQKYRTAKKGEGTCPQCVHSLKPGFMETRIRCGDWKFSQATGKTKTCDAFHRKETATEKEGDLDERQT